MHAYTHTYIHAYRHVHRHEEDLIDVFANRRDDIVILSPDSETTLTHLDKNKIYVIGGIVDRTVRKGATLQRAMEMGVPTVRLPVSENVPRDAQVCVYIYIYICVYF